MLPIWRKLLIVFSFLASLILLRRILSRSKTENINFPGYKDCVKKQKIAFLKTHKCASSSVQNILFRFGLKNHLTFALPSTGNYLGRYVKYSKQMLASTIWDKVGLEYDIFALHTIWNKAEVERTLGPGATFVTIMRDPVDLFESLWGYAALGKYYGTDLETFALAEKKGKLSTRAYRNLGRNQMLWDSGLEASQMNNLTAVQQKIFELDRTFDLVMMADRFDESMILMKDLLCWDYEDVVNFKLNARKESKKVGLSEEARAELKKYLAADYTLYQHFQERFEQRIEEFGRARMNQELRILRTANEKMKAKCGLEVADNDQINGPNKLTGQGMVAYKTAQESDSQCQNFAISEMNFIEHLREIQADRAADRAHEMRLGDISEDHINSAINRLPNLRSGILDIEKLKSIYIHS